MHTHAGSAFDNHVTLTFDFLTSRSTRAERLPCTVGLCLSRLVLIAHVVFLSERGHTGTHSHRHHDIVRPQSTVEYTSVASVCTVDSGLYDRCSSDVEWLCLTGLQRHPSVCSLFTLSSVHAWLDVSTQARTGQARTGEWVTSR